MIRTWIEVNAGYSFLLWLNIFLFFIVIIIPDYTRLKLM